MLLVAIVALLSAWIVGAGWLAVAGDSALDAFGSDVSRWLVPALFACAPVIAVVPLVAGVAVLDHIVRPSEEGRRQAGRLTTWLLASTAAWVAAIVMAAALLATIPGLRDVWGDGEGRIPFMETTYCFYDGTNDAHCLPGDERVVIGNAERSPSEVPLMRSTPFPAEEAAPAEPAVPTVPRLRPERELGAD